MSEFGGLRKHEKTKHALIIKLGLGSATLLQLAFLGEIESDPNFPWEKIPLEQESVKKKERGLD